MKTILVPIDFSNITDRVIAVAVEQARLCGARLCLLHVEAPEPEFIGFEPGPSSVRDNVAHAMRAGHQELQRREADLKQQGIETTALLVQGIAVEKILGEVERLKADLIVMGSHGHGALYDLLAGSVTDGVLRKARCPVLVVPARCVPGVQT